MYSNRRTFCGKLAFTGSLCSLFARANYSAWDDPPPHDEKKAAGDDSDKDKVYEPGGDVKPPKLLHYVEPSFSPKSKEAFVEGVVRLSTVVTTEGTATDLHILSGLNAEEDKNAMEAVKQWKFQPGTKSGQPVRVKVTVEVQFHLL